jgi:hypothetical protein
MQDTVIELLINKVEFGINIHEKNRFDPLPKFTIRAMSVALFAWQNQLLASCVFSCASGTTNKGNALDNIASCITARCWLRNSSAQGFNDPFVSISWFSCALY